MYLQRMRTLLDQWIQPPDTPSDQLRLERRISEIAQQLAPDEPLDFAKWGSWGQAPTWEEQLALLTDVYLPGRRKFLYDSLARANGGQLPPAPTKATAIQFAAVEYNPASADQDQEYIELYNPNDFAMDMSGWLLDGPVQFTFDPGTVIPAGGRLYVSPKIRAFRSRATGPTGGQGLLVVGNYDGRISNFGEVIELKGADGSPVAATTTPTVGDVNGNRVFDSQDLQQLLQAGKYLTAIAATPVEGDLNGDAVFNQHDIVFALQAGTFRVVTAP
jgi:hypothetical protein